MLVKKNLHNINVQWTLHWEYPSNIRPVINIEEVFLWGPASRKVLSPRLNLTTEETMVAMVIGELKVVFKPRIFLEYGPRPTYPCQSKFNVYSRRCIQQARFLGVDAA